MKRIFNVFFTAWAFFLLTVPHAFAGDTYKFDPVHSSVTFSVRHMIISNVKGAFDKFEGEIDYDKEDITVSSVEVTIDAASVNTKHEKRDSDLRSEPFLNTAEFPTLAFKSASIIKADQGYAALGDLTIRGVTKRVELPFVVHGPIINPMGQSVMGVEIEYELNRHDYGISWSKTLDGGGLVVGETVKIEIQVEAIKL